MKKITLTALALAAAVTVSAGGLDLQSRAMMRRNAVLAKKGLPTLDASAQQKDYNEATLGMKSAKSSVMEENNSGFTMGFVTIDDGYDRSDLEAAGFKVLTVRGDIAIVSLPIDSAMTWANRAGVKTLSLQRPVKPMLDRARADAGVDDIHNGVGLDLPYTGKGVMTGIVDQGVDPNHISFLKFDEENPEGKTRVRYLSYFDGYADRNGEPNVSFYGDNLYYLDPFGKQVWYPTADAFVTDFADAYHGTHTLNILAGGYKGDVTVLDVPEGSLIGRPKKVANPYYGVAPDADIAVSCGYLADACIAYGIDYMLGYADDLQANENMPTLLSLSLGSTSGPHDPRSQMNRFLELCGEDYIIVLAAGNEGDLKIVVKNECTEQAPAFASMIYPFAYRYDKNASKNFYNNHIRYGSVVIYASDERPFSVNAILYDKDRGRVVTTMGGLDTETGGYYLSDRSFAEGYENEWVNSTLGRYFNGYVGGGAMLDEGLNRYYALFDYYLYNKLNVGTDIDEDGNEMAMIGFQIVGQPGQTFECYCDGDFTWLSNYGLDNINVSGVSTLVRDGQRDGTISDMAVGENVLVVGAYTLRKEWFTLSGDGFSYNESDGFVIGDIGQYTSYGTLNDGRTLPHVCAPGSAVISAISRPFVKAEFAGNENYIDRNMTAKATINGNDYYWVPETGTSMSTPFVAGAIALWLEADPTLKIDDVKDIVAKTARRDEFVEKGNQVQWGAGKFDALAGLKEVIKRAGIQGVTVDGNNDRLIFTPAGKNVFDVFVGDAGSLDVSLYSLSGARVYNNVFAGCEATVDFSSLTPGVYAVNVNGHSKKIVIK